MSKLGIFLGLLSCIKSLCLVLSALQCPVTYQSYGTSQPESQTAASPHWSYYPLFTQSSLLLTGCLCSFWSLISGFTSFMAVWRGQKHFSRHRQSLQMCEMQTWALKRSAGPTSLSVRALKDSPAAV